MSLWWMTAGLKKQAERGGMGRESEMKQKAVVRYGGVC